MKDIEGSVRNSYNICTPNNFEIKYNVKKCLLKILKLWNSWQFNSVFFTFNIEIWKVANTMLLRYRRGQRSWIFYLISCLPFSGVDSRHLGWAIGLFSCFFSSRQLCRSCLAKIAFNRLCQLVSERSVGHPTTSFFLFFFLSFPRDRAARRNLSWCLFFFFLSGSDFHDVHQIFTQNFPVFEQCEVQNRIWYY